MMRSMTGFGQASGRTPSFSVGIRVEASSVNRKQFEVKFILPDEIASCENQLRNLVAEHIHRGSVTLRIDFLEGAAPDTVCKINLNAAKRLAETAGDIASQCHLETGLTAAALLAIPGVIRTEPDCPPGGEVEALLRKVVPEALRQLLKSREAEGERLKKDVAARIETLKKTVAEIEPLTRKMPRLQYEKLLARLRELDLSADSDDGRLLRELVIYADRLDVSEEITRIRSHFKQFDTLLSEDDPEPAGRRLDFIAQELFREFNTLGNKAASIEVSPLVVVLKTELEKIREQIQNIE